MAQPVSMPPHSEVVYNFNQDQIYMALRMVQDYDKDKQQYKQAEPRIVLSINGDYQWVPVDPYLFRKWGEFLINLSTLVEDIEIPQEEVDIEEIRRRLLACSNRGDKDV